MFELAETPVVGYSPEFLRRVREKREKAAAEARGNMQEAAEKALLERAALLKSEASKALADAMARKAARAEAESIERRLIQKSAVIAASTDFQWIFAKAMVIFDVTKAEIKGSGRNRRVAFARQFIMYWARRRTGMSSPQIGRHLGGKDHSTVLHGCGSYVKKRARMGRTLRPLR